MAIINDETRVRQERDLEIDPKHPLHVCHWCGHLGADVHFWGSYVGGKGNIDQCDDFDECRYRKDRRAGIDAAWHLVLLTPWQRRRLDIEMEVVRCKTISPSTS